MKYCRACGEDKGHNTPKCKNAAKLRECLHLTDAELETTMARAVRAEDELKEEAFWKTQCAFQARIIAALMDLVEAKRAGAK